MTYAEKLAFETANEIFELDLICKRIDEFESRSVESTIQAAINQAMKAQREACLQNSIQAQKERFGLEHDDMSDWVKQAILNAEVQP